MGGRSLSSTTRGVVYLAAAQLAFMASGYITNVWLGRHLGPAVYGTYGVLIALMTALNVLQVAGIPQAVSRYVAEDEVAADGILKAGLRAQLLLTATLSVALFSCAPIIAAMFRSEGITNYVRAIALVLPPYGVYALYGGYYNGRRNFRRQAAMAGIYAAGKMLVVIGLALAYGLGGVLAGFAIAPLLALATGVRRPQSPRWDRSRDLIGYSLPLMSFAVLASLQVSVDLFSLRSLVSDVRVSGYYTAAQNIALIPLFTVAALSQVIFPSVSRLVSLGRRAEAARDTWAAIRYLLIVLLPGTALIAATAPALVALLFGPSYAPAAPVLRLLVISYVSLSVFTLLGSVLSGAGLAGRAAMLAGMGAAVTTLACWLLVPNHGAAGAALATGLGGLLAAVGGLLVTARLFPPSLSPLSLIRIGTGAVLLLVCGWLINPSPTALPALWLGLGGVYTGWLWLSKEFTVADIARISRVFRSSDRPT